MFEPTGSELAEDLPLSLGGHGHPGNAGQVGAGPMQDFLPAARSNIVSPRHPASALSPDRPRWQPRDKDLARLTSTHVIRRPLPLLQDLPVQPAGQRVVGATPRSIHWQPAGGSGERKGKETLKPQCLGLRSWHSPDQGSEKVATLTSPFPDPVQDPAQRPARG